MEALQERLALLQPIFENEPLTVAVYLFGSQVDGYAMPWSDIDLAVLWAEPVDFRTELALDAQIALALGTDAVDVVNLGRCPLALQFRVVAEGILFYERDPTRVADFTQRTLVRYYDFQPVLQIYHREFMRSLEHDYGS